MTCNEYLTTLETELKKKHIADTADIVEEYEQHFAFKLADGFSEEEIAAKLGAPAAIAAQFEAVKTATPGTKANNGGSIWAKIGMACLIPFEWIGFILLSCWAVVLGASALACAAVGVCLIAQIDVFMQFTLLQMPVLSGLIIGTAMLAIGVLFGAGCCYFFAFLKQLVRADIRWHKNVVSGAALPPLPTAPQLKTKSGRALRRTFLISTAVFGVLFVLGFVISAILAGEFGFWHAWNWFVK